MTFNEFNDLYQKFLEQSNDSPLIAQVQLLPTMNIAERLHRTAIFNEGKKTLDKISKLSSSFKSPDLSAEDIKSLTTFLAERDEEVTCTALGYTTEPNSPANQFCKSIAEKLYEDNIKNNPSNSQCKLKNKALYSILMPSLDITGTSSIFLNVCEESDDLPDYGTFLLTDSLLDVKTGPVIAFNSVVSNAKELYFFTYMFYGQAKARTILKPDSKYHKLDSSNLKDMVFTKNEIARLRTFTPEGKTFFQEQDSAIVYSLNQTTPRQQLQALIEGLKRGSAYGGEGGTHLRASSAATEALGLFFEYWNNLPSEVRASLGNCTNYNGVPLQYVLDIYINNTNPTNAQLATNTITCANNNWPIIASILKNDSNAALLDITHQQTTVEKDTSDSFDKAIEKKSGQDGVNGYPEAIYKEFYMTIDVRSCAKLIELSSLADERSGRLDALLRHFITLLEQVPTIANEQQKSRKIVLIDCFYELSEQKRSKLYAQIKSKWLTWNLTITDLKRTLHLLSPADLKDACTLIDVHADHLMTTVTHFNDLLDTEFLTPDQTLIICRDLKNIIKKIAINKTTLLTLLTPRTNDQIIVICENLEFYFKTAAECGELLQAANNSVREVIYKSCITHLFNQNLIKTHFDFTNLLQYLTDSECLWVCESFSKQLQQAITEQAQFISFMLMLSSSKRAVIASVLDVIWLGQMVESVNDFTEIFAFLVGAKKDDFLNHISQESFGLIGSLRNKSALEFKNFLHPIPPAMRSHVYETLKNDLINMINSPDDFYNILLYLEENQRTAVYNTLLQHNKLSIIIKNIKNHTLGNLLKLLNQAQCAQVCNLLPPHYLKNNFNAEQFKKLLGSLNANQRPLILNIFKSELSGIIKNATDLHDVGIYLPEKINDEIYAALPLTVCENFINSESELLQVLTVISNENVAKIWSMVQVKARTIFPSAVHLKRSLCQNKLIQQKCTFIKNKLCELVTERFIPIYNALRDGQDSWDFCKTNFIESDKFKNAAGFEQVLCLWQHIDQHPIGRASKAWALALGDLVDDQLKNAIYLALSPAPSSSRTTNYPWISVYLGRNNTLSLANQLRLSRVDNELNKSKV